MKTQQLLRVTVVGLVLAGCGPGPSTAVPAGPAVSIIPVPAILEVGSGTVRMDEPVRIRVAGNFPNVLDAQLEAWIAERAAEQGALFERSESPDSDVVVHIGGTWSEGSGTESYQITTEGDRVMVYAPAPEGAFYALQTLRQVVRDVGDAVEVPEMTVSDSPRFRYRGLHLDVGRHFFGAEQVKRYIDLMSRYKFNTFHWHLTEDQGWRMPIDAYPRLNEIASCRSETMVEKNFDPYVGDGVPHCGHYTKDEVREIVQYAAERFVTVIPEIELPGHSLAALAAYPELACTEGPFEVGTRWGVYEDIYCPKEETFAFLETVLTEVMELFPSRYIHIGGDEAPKVRWEESAVAQDVIRREGLADEHELQSWFIRRIENFLLTHGRNIIGWDEILEGGLAPEATVMSWRGMAGGIEAARMGHDVIMTPGSHVYFDHYQGPPEEEPLAIGGFSPLSRVYEFEPVPEELTTVESRHVLGAQANLWTEYIPTWEHAEYMTYPRALALSEVVWSPADARDWDGFLARLPGELAHLDHLDVNYRVPDVEGLDGDRLTLDAEVRLELTLPLPDAEIRYTTDGSDPLDGATVYRGPITIPIAGESVTISARGFLPSGRTTNLKRSTVSRAVLRPSDDRNVFQPGLERTYYEGRWATVAEMLATEPLSNSPAEAPALSDAEPQEFFGMDFRGWIRVPVDGIYGFELTSDDGSVLWIGDSVVVDHDGLHGPTMRAGEVALAAGVHPIRVTFFQNGGGKALDLRVRIPGQSEAQPIPSEWFGR